MRGEYDAEGGAWFTVLELPPRARRIPSNVVSNAVRVGTTSACAENTRGPRRVSLPIRNYLRVRGEYAPARALGIFSSELPPRARRIQVAAGGPQSHLGTTSACAENTGLGMANRVI